MEKVPEPYEVRTPPVRLYLDDVETFRAILAEASGGAVEMKVGQWRLEDPSELRQLPAGQAPGLGLGIKEPGISIHLHRAGGWVRAANGDDLVSRGAVQQIESVLRKRRDWIATVGLWPAQVVGSVLFAVGFTRSLMRAPNPRLSLLLAGVGLTLVCNSFFRLSRTTKVILRFRQDEDPWIKRNGDDLLKIGIATVFSALLGWVIGRG